MMVTLNKKNNSKSNDKYNIKNTICNFTLDKKQERRSFFGAHFKLIKNKKDEGVSVVKTKQPQKDNGYGGIFVDGYCSKRSSVSDGSTDTTTPTSMIARSVSSQNSRKTRDAIMINTTSDSSGSGFEKKKTSILAEPTKCDREHSCGHSSTNETRQFFAQSSQRQLPPASLLFERKSKRYSMFSRLDDGINDDEGMLKSNAKKSDVIATEASLNDLARTAMQLFPGTLPRGIPPHRMCAVSTVNGERNHKTPFKEAGITIVDSEIIPSSKKGRAVGDSVQPRSNLFHALKEYDQSIDHLSTSLEKVTMKRCSTLHELSIHSSRNEGQKLTVKGCCKASPRYSLMNSSSCIIRSVSSSSQMQDFDRNICTKSPTTPRRNIIFPCHSTTAKEKSSEQLIETFFSSPGKSQTSAVHKTNTKDLQNSDGDDDYCPYRHDNQIQWEASSP